jgi:hypothetical protein
MMNDRHKKWSLRGRYNFSGAVSLAENRGSINSLYKKDREGKSMELYEAYSTALHVLDTKRLEVESAL